MLPLDFQTFLLNVFFLSGRYPWFLHGVTYDLRFNLNIISFWEGSFLPPPFNLLFPSHPPPIFVSRMCEVVAVFGTMSRPTDETHSSRHAGCQCWTRTQLFIKDSISRTWSANEPAISSQAGRIIWSMCHMINISSPSAVATGGVFLSDFMPLEICQFRSHSHVWPCMRVLKLTFDAQACQPS